MITKVKLIKTLKLIEKVLEGELAHKYNNCNWG